MGARLTLRQGTGYVCRICGKKIEIYHKQITFKGWNSGAVIHSDSRDCDRKKRLSKQTGGC